MIIMMRVARSGYPPAFKSKYTTVRILISYLKAGCRASNQRSARQRHYDSKIRMRVACSRQQSLNMLWGNRPLLHSMRLHFVARHGRLADTRHPPLPKKPSKIRFRSFPTAGKQDSSNISSVDSMPTCPEPQTHREVRVFHQSRISS